MRARGADEREAPTERRLTLSPDAEAWVATEEPAMPSVEETPPEGNTLVARYFREVRRYALLSVGEAHALWAQIEHCKVRGRRALYMSPVALATLTQRPPRSTRSPSCTRRCRPCRPSAGLAAAPRWSGGPCVRHAPDTGTSGSRSGRPWGSPPASRRPFRRPWTTPCTPSPLRRPSAPHPRRGRAPNGHSLARKRGCSRRTSASSLLSRSAIATAVFRCWISFKKAISG